MAWRGMVLYRIWIYCIVLLVPSWYHMVLHWYGIVLNFIARYWVSFHYIVWYFMSLYCIWFQCIVLHVISTKVLYTSPHPEIPIQSTHPLIAPHCYIRLWRVISLNCMLLHSTYYIVVYFIRFHCMVLHVISLYCMVLNGIVLYLFFCTVSHCHVPLLQRAGELPRSASSHFL